jgi:hypothetical protein
MNDDFELRRRLADLKRDIDPAAALWPGIAARLAATPQNPAPRIARFHGGWRMALAASLVAAAALALSGLQQRRESIATAQIGAERAQAAPFVAGQVRSLESAYAGAIDELRAQPSDTGASVSPTLMAAAARLDAAEAELKAKLAQEPRATYLIEMLGRTQAKRLELEKMMRSA